MRLHGIVLLAAILPLFVSCGGAGDNNSDSLGVATSGLAIPYFNGAVVGVNGRAIALVSESSQGVSDLNQDGDAADNVVHMLVPVTRAVTNLRVTARPPLVGGSRFAAWSAAEMDEGRDLNGDGDGFDHVLVVFDTAAPVSLTNPLNTTLTTSPNSPIIALGDTFVFATLEFDNGSNLNGDADLNDLVLRSFDALTGIVRNTGHAWDTNALGLTVQAGLVAFTVSEDDDGMADWNADGDSSDSVLFALQLSTGNVVAIGATAGRARAVAPGVAIGGTAADAYLVYGISESDEGAINLNAGQLDTDSEDFIAAVHRFNTGVETRPLSGIAVDPTQFAANASRVVFVAVENQNSPVANFNGDGDSEDHVPFWLALSDPATAYSLAIAARAGSGNPQLTGTRLVYVASEHDQGAGGSNWNVALGDTDTDDFVAWFFDLAAAPAVAACTNIATAEALLFGDDDFFFITGDESSNNAFDLNEDGDGNDIVPVYFRIAGSTIGRGTESINTDGPLTFQVTPADIRIFANARESTFGDMNEDGDQDDHVLLCTRISRANGEIRSFNILTTTDVDGSAFARLLDGDFIAFPYSESTFKDGRDGNFDGDATDLVLTYVNTISY